MLSEFTEFSYGFAVTHELVLANSGSIFAAPEFPSLIREGQLGGGYDVRLDFGTFLFLQFKLSEYMHGARSGQGEVIAPPYYRFWIAPRSRSQQHEMLVDLAEEGNEVYYAAPIFHEQTAFNAAFQEDSVVTQSAFFRPSDIGYLEDDDYHCMTFNAALPHGYFCSQPRQVRAHTGVSLKDFVVRRMEPHVPVPTLEIADALTRIARLRDQRVPPLRERSPEEAMAHISFVAHVFFHSEVFFVPAP
jgi:hypothetical protein